MIRFYGEEAGYTILGGGLQSIAMLSGGALGGDVVFTRNSIGWDWGMVQYAIDTPRYYSGGLIVEKQQENAALRLDYWLAPTDPYTVTLGQTDIAGGTDGVLLTSEPGDGRTQQAFSPGLPNYAAATGFMKIDPSTVDYLDHMLWVRDQPQTGWDNARVNINIDSGVVTEIGDDVSATYQVIGDWVLFRMISTAFGPNGCSQISIGGLNAGNSVTVCGITSASNAASTPIVTGSSRVTRAADYVSQDLSAVVTDTHQVHLDVELAWGIGAVGELDEYQVLESMDDGTGNEGVEIVRYGDGTIRLRVIDGGVVTVDQSLGTVTHGQRLKIWRGFHNGTHYAQIEGGTLVQAAAAMPSGRVERIGNRGHTDGAEHAQSCATHYTHVVYPDILSVSIGQAFIG